jgi:rod shape-determining protein MreC
MINRKKRNKIKSRHLLVLLSFICVSLIALTMTSVVPIRPLQNVVGIVITPLQKGINEFGSWFGNQTRSVQDVKKLSEENKNLKQQVSRLQEENTVLSENKGELDRLRAMYQLDGDYAQYEKAGARVIAREAGDWYSTFTIDKGSDSGIEKDMNVVTGDGLVGIVTKVGKNWATVKSIIDDSVKVSAMTVNSLDTCVVSGNLELMAEGKMEFGQMKTQDQISPGERVVTSNISDKFLEGIPIGYVDSVNEDSNHLTKNGYIIPSVDFAHLHEVLVIKKIKQTGGKE